MKEKFTNGEWFVGTFNDVFGIANVTINADAGRGKRSTTIACMSRMGGIRTQEEYDADAELLASAKLLYENAQKNLEVIKTLLKVYEELQNLFENDTDVQAVFHDLPKYTFLHIIDKLKTRITKTENILAKARGEE